MRDTIIVTGSRDYSHTSTVFDSLSRIAKHNPQLTRLVQGGATGADAIALGWAMDSGLQWFTYAVDPALDGPWPGAGPRRNRRMLEAEKHRAAIVVWFSSSGQFMTRGTSNCIETAKRMGLPVIPGELALPSFVDAMNKLRLV